MWALVVQHIGFALAQEDGEPKTVNFNVFSAAFGQFGIITQRRPSHERENNRKGATMRPA
jgi:hypothetical protein